MRAIFGLVGLLVALTLVGMLVKQQLQSTRAPLSSVPTLPATSATTGPAAAAASAPAAATAPAATVREQSQQMQQQVKEQMEGLMQQARPMPEDPQ